MEPAELLNPKTTSLPSVVLNVTASPATGRAIDRKGFVALPLYADAASLGKGRAINENEIESFLVVERSNLSNPESCVCIKVMGDSMDPVFLTGDIVAIDFSQNDPSRLDGAFVACRVIDGEVTVKQLRIKPPHFHLKDLNRVWEDEYGPMLVRKKDVTILGKIIWQWRTFQGR